ncbi:MAG: response regulator [Chitinivibrionales bacterium]|nr:response regulator [Chitinivibrionales bacterium]MBD3358668.1 response regulator [Chitinivibrionales bacterium]
MAYTIMVVDDSETIRSVLERTIKMTKLPVDRILEAPNGKEALVKLADDWVDIIFTDLNMPEMSGSELVDALNEDVELRDVPVVIVSTEGSQTRIEELRKKGIRGYLRKPFTPESIRDIIINTLGEWDG